MLCAEISERGGMSIELYSDGARSVHLRNRRISLVVMLEWSNFECELIVREFDRKLAVPASGEQPIYASGQPKEVRVTRFLPELNRAREYGWIEQGQSPPFITCESLANQIVIQFVDLVEQAERTGPQRSFR